MVSQNYWPLRQGDFTEMTMMPDMNVQLQRKKWSCTYVPHFLYLSSFPLPTLPTHRTRLPVSICPRVISMLGTLCPESTFRKASDISQSPLHTREIWLSQQGYHISSSDREKEKSGMKGRQPEWWKTESLSQHLKAVAEEGGNAGSKLMFYALVSIILLLFNLMCRHISQLSCQPAIVVVHALVPLSPRFAGCSPAPFVHIPASSGTMTTLVVLPEAALRQEFKRKLFGKWPQETLKGSAEVRWGRKESQ